MRVLLHTLNSEVIGEHALESLVRAMNPEVIGEHVLESRIYGLNSKVIVRTLFRESRIEFRGDK
jgi:hypothetical protein